MVDNPKTERQRGSARPWWREGEIACLVLLVVAGYAYRAGTLPLRGEEPTRAQIAREMVERGDWLVPREQGEPFRIRPPLQNWVIAATCLALRSWDLWVVRLPSVLATLLTTLLIYGYSRTVLSRLGALAAAVSFVTLADMFAMGRQAETEALFILFVSASLLIWHWGFVRHWPDVLTWGSGYSLMTLAMLTKGVQAPLYFVGAVGVYLIGGGQGRRLLSLGHLVGACAGLILLAAWIIPYSLVMGWSGVYQVWMGDPAVRVLNGLEAQVVLVHLLIFPLEVAAGTLPWSPLLLLYVSRGFRQSIHEERRHVLFLGICLAVAFPTCWLPPSGRPRFFAPLYPCLAVLIGLVVQRCSEAAAPGWRTVWRRYLGTMACVMAALGVTVVAAALVLSRHATLAARAEAPLPAVGYAAGALALATLTWRARAPGSARTRVAVLSLAGFLLITFSGVLTNIRLRRASDPAFAMEQLKERLPHGQQLVSFGHLDARFPYYYGLPFIPSRPVPIDADANVTYFCVNCTPGTSRPRLPFRWKEIGVIPMDRNHHPVPERVVVVGVRLEQGESD